MYANTPCPVTTGFKERFGQRHIQHSLLNPVGNISTHPQAVCPKRGATSRFDLPTRATGVLFWRRSTPRLPQAITFRIVGGLSNSAVHVWETNSSRTFEHVSDVFPKLGIFHYTFDPDSLYSLTTTTGQGKGTAVPSPPSSFPFPYTDDFDHATLNRAPKYLADQDGAFEVHPCVGRSGQCLEQVISSKPIPWGPLPDPFTMAGDDKWTDYTVSADAYFPTEAAAVIMGRIDSADIFRDAKARWPSGYVLRVKRNGPWELLSTQFNKPVVRLASGSADLTSGQWHRLALRFQGNRILALLDGVQLTAVEDTTHTHGMFAVGTGWNHIQFDNLEATP